MADQFLRINPEGTVAILTLDETLALAVDDDRYGQAFSAWATDAKPGGNGMAYPPESGAFYFPIGLDALAINPVGPIPPRKIIP